MNLGTTLGTLDTKFRTLSGRRVDLIAPDPNDIFLDDIIASQVRQWRYAGHTDTALPFTNSEHSVLTTRLAKHVFPQMPVEFHGCVFHHDSPETYTNDLPSPFKQALRILGGGAALEQIEGGLERAIHQHFLLPYPMPEGWKEKIKYVDLLAARIEESHFRPDPKERKYLPPGFPENRLPRPLSNEIERKLRSLACWNSIKAEMLAVQYRVEFGRSIKSRPSAGLSVN